MKWEEGGDRVGEGDRGTGGQGRCDMGLRRAAVERGSKEVWGLNIMYEL